MADQQDRPDGMVLRVIGLTGEDLGVLAYGVESPALSWDGTRLAYPSWPNAQYTWYNTIRVRDLVNGSDTDLGLRLDSSFQVSWAPSGNRIALTDHQDVAVLDLGTLELTTLLDCSQMSWEYDAYVFCGVLAWSPDGRWIAHGLYLEATEETDALEGIYLLDSNCMSDASTCRGMDHFVGPYGYYGTWSPDGRFLASAGANGEVYIFDVALWTLDHVLQSDRDFHSLRWSPDGRWLGYSTDREVGVMSPSSGEISVLRRSTTDSLLWFWLESPPPDLSSASSSDNGD